MKFREYLSENKEVEITFFATKSEMETHREHLEELGAIDNGFSKGQWLLTVDKEKMEGTKKKIEDMGLKVSKIDDAGARPDIRYSTFERNPKTNY